MNKNPQKIA